MFSEHIKLLEEKIQSHNFSTTRVEKILDQAKNGKRLSLEELGDLLSVNPEKEFAVFNKVLDTSRKIKEKVFKNRIFPIVPVYVSSFCIEHCEYCNYRVENQNKMVKRICLSLNQLEKELKYLIVNKGFRVVELVYGSDPKIISHIPKHIKLAHSILNETGGGMVGINAQPFSTEEYRILKESGLDFVILWQETYQLEYYKRLHPGKTPKTNFKFRVDSFERMIEAGIRHFGLGVLSGLAPWRKDWLLLTEHERYLFNKYGIKASIVGIPRLKPAIGALIQSTPFIPSDKEFLLVVAVHNLFSPETLPFINTRENFNLCLELAKGGGSLFTFNCSTIPGGYTLGVRGYQFITYNFDINEHLPKLESKGLIPKINWNFGCYS